MKLDVWTYLRKHANTLYLILPAAAASLAALLALIHAPWGVRLPLGVLATLYLPGHALSLIAFPHARDLRRAERASLSIGLSLVLVAVAALALDRSPAGLKPLPLIVALTALTVGLTAIAWRLRTALGGAVEMAPDPRRLPALSRRAPRATLVLGATLVLACLALFVVLGGPQPPSTSFYLLGKDGSAEQYPRTALVGQGVTIIAGIVNRERSTSTYVIVVRDGDAILATTSSISVAVEQTNELSVTFAPNRAGRDQRFEITLHKDGDARPYRQLRLWVDVLG